MLKLKNQWKTLHFLIFLQLLPIGHIGCISCGRAEYKIGDQCCPTCEPGTRVEKHCTDYTSTTCAPCTDSTYLDQHNGRTSCFPCTYCDQGIGLKVKQHCTPKSDAICEPVDGYHCTLPANKGCAAAQEHSRCKPGQRISQEGTSSKDTECSDCPGDTFSNGSLTHCQPLTKCELLGLAQLKPGNQSADAECGPHPKSSVGLIVGLVFLILSLVIGTCIYIYCRRRKKPVEDSRKTETTPIEESFKESNGESLLAANEESRETQSQNPQPNTPV